MLVVVPPAGGTARNSHAHDVPISQYPVRTKKGQGKMQYVRLFASTLALSVFLIMMGAHGCEHSCATCGKCNDRSCPNRVKCRGHK